MRHFLNVATFITMFGVVVALPIWTVILYRGARGSRSATVGTFLWAAAWALLLIMPAALTLDDMGWIPPDAGISMAPRKLNSSFALLAVQATTRYLLGEQEEAAADFATLEDELRSRGHQVQP